MVNTDNSTQRFLGVNHYRIYLQYWDTLSTYHIVTSSKIWNRNLAHLLICLKYSSKYGKQCRPWSDAAFSGVWSGSILSRRRVLGRLIWVYTICKGLSVPISRLITVSMLNQIQWLNLLSILYSYGNLTALWKEQRECHHFETLDLWCLAWRHI